MPNTKKYYAEKGYKIILKNQTAAELYRTLLTEEHNATTYCTKTYKGKKRYNAKIRSNSLITNYFSAWRDLGYLEEKKTTIKTKRLGKPFCTTTEVYTANLKPCFEYIEKEYKLNKKEMEYLILVLSSKSDAFRFAFAIMKQEIPEHSHFEQFILENINKTPKNPLVFFLDAIQYHFLMSEVEEDNDEEEEEDKVHNNVMRKLFPHIPLFVSYQKKV